MSNLEENSKNIPRSGEASPAVLSGEEIWSIKIHADLRRRQTEFKATIQKLKSPAGGDYTRERTKQHIFREAEGEIAKIPWENKEDLEKHSDDLVAKAREKEKTFPKLAAYLFAEAAKRRQIAGLDFQQEYEYAKILAEKEKTAPKAEPGDFLTDAVLIGIAKREAKKISVPPPEKAARAVAKDKNLAKSYALVLSEKERNEFLRLLLENSRREISAIMDLEVISLLKENIVSSESEVVQRENVRERSKKEIKNAFKIPEETTRALVKVLSLTLSRLGGEDSREELYELGKSGLSGENEKEKRKMKISHAARILQTLFDIDAAKGSELGMKFLAKSDIPDRLFSFFCAN